MYIVYHRILSSVPIGEIRRHAIISSLLQKLNTRMSIHLWSEDDTDIANLGFFVQIDPTNLLHDELEERVKHQIAIATKRPIKKIPRFHCGYTSPFLLNNDNNCTSTKSYDLQCHRKDAKDLIDLLQATYRNNPFFVFHKLRHRNQDAYKSTICKQNAFLSRIKVIPIQGISPDLMFYLHRELEQVEGILDICHHKLTNSAGRWSVITTADNFQTLSNYLQANLPTWAAHHAQTYNIDLSELPPVGTAYKNRPYPEESDGTFESYWSMCASVYTLDAADEFNQPPAYSAPIPQAWDTPLSIPQIVKNSRTTASTSTLSPDDNLRADNERLKKQVDELKREMAEFKQERQRLLNQQQQLQSPALASTPSTVTLRPEDLARIVELTSQTVIASFQQHFPTAPAQAHPALPDSDNELDLSMDASDTPKQS